MITRLEEELSSTVTTNLQSILKKPLHRALKRLQGMQKYDLEVRYEKGNKMFLVGTRSRAYLPSSKQGESETINMIKFVPMSEARLLQIQRATEMDESLQILKAAIQQGWPEDKSALRAIISPYFNMRNEMCKRSGSDTFLALLDHTGIQISPVQRLLNRRTRSLLPMTAG